MRLVLLPILFLGACPPKPPPVPTPSRVDMAQPPVNVVACPINVLAVVDENCDGFFTRDRQMACARCPGGGACYDSTDFVYCAANESCFNDPNCFKDDEGTVSSKKPTQRPK